MVRFLADSNVVGVSVGVERGSEVIVRGEWGLADRGTGGRRPRKPPSAWDRAAKQFTAALVIKLVERGVVGLDDPVDRHVPQMPRKWLGITVRQTACSFRPGRSTPTATPTTSCLARSRSHYGKPLAQILTSP
jgi:CubicO group peptidase (beta-lactamase class C family)